MIEAFPLSWPAGWPRTKNRRSSPYRVSTDTAMNGLLSELRLMGARDVIVSSNVPLRRDGTMYRGDHSDSPLTDPGVAVYWTARKNGQAVPRVIPCDVWLTPRENVRALGMAIEYLRGLERTGAGEILERAFQGFNLLPAGSDHWEELGLDGATLRHASPDAARAAVNAAHRALATTNHPDRGGSTESMTRINLARDAALREIAAR